MTRPPEDQSLFDAALTDIGHEARLNTLDGIYATLHNAGYSLQGNTEESDLKWFAQRLYDQMANWKPQPRCRWENLTDDQRSECLLMASAVLRVLPLLLGRMSSRCILASQAVRTLLDMERRREEKAGDDR